MRHPFLHIKPRLCAQGGVANPRTTPYREDLHLALSMNTSVLFQRRHGAEENRLTSNSGCAVWCAV